MLLITKKKKMTFYLDAESGVILFKQIIPNIKSPIHLCGEEHSRSNRTPRAISKIRHVESGKEKVNLNFK